MIQAVRNFGIGGWVLRAPQGGTVVKLHGGLGAHLRPPLEPGGTALTKNLLASSANPHSCVRW